MQLLPEERLLLFSVKMDSTLAELDYMNSLIPKVQDWDYLVDLAIKRQIGPLLLRKLSVLSRSKEVPDSVYKKLQQAYHKTLTRGMILSAHFRIVSEAFTSNHIQVIALKGIYLSEWLYSDIGLRQFSDIDLLVKKEDGEKCIQILDNLGYRPPGEFKLSEFVKENFDPVHFPPRIKDGASIEVHTRLSGKGEKYQLNLDEIWANAKPVVIHGIPTLSLGLNDLLLHLCLHLDKHFIVGEVQFTCFNDITNLLSRHVGEIDWDAFVETCRLTKANNYTYKYLLLAHKYMNAPIPTMLLEKFSHLLSVREERMFVKYLKASGKNVDYATGVFSNVRKISGFTQKVRFLWGMTFPPIAFMMERYHLNTKTKVYLYYPIRFLSGIKAGLIYIKNLF